MPDGFEYVVRPWQSPNAHGQIRIPATPSRGGREAAHLQWGGQGTMPQVRVTGVDFNTRKPNDERLNEQKRESDIIRIEQPGKPENYVDVARARQVDLTKQTDEWIYQNLAEEKYAASGLDPALLAYEAEIYRNPNVLITDSNVRWVLKNVTVTKG
jgi:hypothetical protein